MIRHTLLSLARRRPHWLLWLALLLPLAQMAGAAHILWHAQQDSTQQQQQQRDADAAHLHACHICTVAAAVGGDALPTHAPSLPVIALPDAPPSAVLHAGILPAPQRRLPIRGPPLLPA
jgi:hypothetical protein